VCVRGIFYKARTARAMAPTKPGIAVCIALPALEVAEPAAEEAAAPPLDAAAAPPEVADAAPGDSWY